MTIECAGQQVNGHLLQHIHNIILDGIISRDSTHKITYRCHLLLMEDSLWTTLTPRETKNKAVVNDYLFPMSLSVSVYSLFLLFLKLAFRYECWPGRVLSFSGKYFTSSLCDVLLHVILSSSYFFLFCFVRWYHYAKWASLIITLTLRADTQSEFMVLNKCTFKLVDSLID